MTKSKRVFWCALNVLVNASTSANEGKDAPVRSRLPKQPQVNLEHRLEQAHVRTLV